MPATVAGLAAVVLWELVLPRGALALVPFFGVGGGLLAMIDTVTLITRGTWISQRLLFCS